MIKHSNDDHFSNFQEKFFETEEKTFDELLNFFSKISPYIILQQQRDILINFYKSGKQIKVKIEETDNTVEIRKDKTRRLIKTIETFQFALKNKYQESKDIRKYLEIIKRNISDSYMLNSDFFSLNISEIKNIDNNQKFSPEEINLLNTTKHSYLLKENTSQMKNLSLNEQENIKNSKENKDFIKTMGANCFKCSKQFDISQLICKECTISQYKKNNDFENYDFKSNSMLKNFENSQSQLLISEDREVSFFLGLFQNIELLSWKQLLERRDILSSFQKEKRIFKLKDCENSESNKKKIYDLILRTEKFLINKRQLSKEARIFLSGLKEQFELN